VEVSHPASAVPSAASSLPALQAQAADVAAVRNASPPEEERVEAANARSAEESGAAELAPDGWVRDGYWAGPSEDGSD